MSEEEDDDLPEIEVEQEEDETPTETLWQRYLRLVPVDEVRRYEALERATLAECGPDKLIDLAAAIEAFLKNGRQTEPRKLKAVKE